MFNNLGRNNLSLYNGVRLCNGGCRTNINICNPSSRSFLTLQCQSRRVFLKKTHSNSTYINVTRQLSTSSEQSLQRIKYAIYGSFAVGGCLMAAIFYRDVYLNIMNRSKGIHYTTDEKCRKKNMMIKYKDVVLPNFVANKIDMVKDFKVRDDDIWIVSYPRSGMMWIQEVIYLVKTMDFESSRNVDADVRIPYLEFPSPSFENLDNMGPRRLIKSHLPLKLLPEQIHTQCPKIVYIARNPKDVVVSYFHLVKSLNPITTYNGKLEDFLESFLRDRVPYSPWSRHVTEFWEIKDQSNVLFITYEEMKKDLKGSIRRVADFLGKTLTPAQITQIAEHCSFEEMKKNPAVNHQWLDDFKYRIPMETEFMRKGEVGDWKKHFSQEMNDKINFKIALKTRDSGLVFMYDENS